MRIRERLRAKIIHWLGGLTMAEARARETVRLVPRNMPARIIRAEYLYFVDSRESSRDQEIPVRQALAEKLGQELMDSGSAQLEKYYDPLQEPQGPIRRMRMCATVRILPPADVR